MQKNLSADKLNEHGAAINDITKKLEMLKKDLSVAIEGMKSNGIDKSERERMRIIMQGQIDMLYDIFMTSALPQYKKDEVGTRINEMKEKLVINE